MSRLRDVTPPASTGRGRARGRPCFQVLDAGLLLALWLVVPAMAAAASPTPSRASSTDTRSPLEGPGFVGAPLAAIAAVLLIAVVAVVVTTVYVRLTTAGKPPKPD